MNKVTVKQLHEAGFSIDGSDLCTAGAGSFKYEHLAPTNYDKDIFIEQLVWRDKAGMQPVGDDCWVILRESGITPGYKRCIASEVSWNDSSWHPQWKPDLEVIAQLASAESIANSEEWNGEGLPPVGKLCEVRFRDDDGWSDWFNNAKFKAGYDSKIWFSHSFGDCVHPAHDVEFRKPLTPAQIAEKAREGFKNDAFSLICDRGWSAGCVVDIIGAMIDAGYRLEAN